MEQDKLDNLIQANQLTIQQNKKLHKKDLFWCDLLVIMAIALCIITHLITTSVISNYQTSVAPQETQATLKQITNIIEQNPLAKIMLNLKGIGYILSNILVPAMVFALYWYLRRQVLKGKGSIDGLVYFSYVSIFIFLINVFNDVGILIGQLI